MKHESDSIECGSHNRLKKNKKKSKKKRKRHSSTSSETSSSSLSREEEKKHKAKKHTKKKLKEKLKKQKKKRKAQEEVEESEIEGMIGPVVPNNLIEQCRRMAPETKEEWEKRQNVIKRVFDEQTGRYRLVKGDGEVLEEIVSKERHKEINKQATHGDGEYFQSKLNQPKKTEN
ncbi:uncharacterized protein [Rhodnius prolixus]